MKVGQRRWMWLAVVLCVTGFSVSPVAAEDKAEEKIVQHTVADGETLGSIALRYKVGITQLMGWNKLESIEIEPDMTLVVHSAEIVRPKPVSATMQVSHTVRAGETFEAIAKKYRVTVKQIQSWNRRVNPRRLQIGQRVNLHVPNVHRDGKSVSWGAANGGRLYNGVAIESGPGVRVRTPSRSYGTQRTVNLLEAAGADVKARWPDSPDMFVGNLSAKHGGRIKPHKSHQSGRDVDIAFYHRGNVEMTEFRNMTAETFDAVKNWHVYKTLIDSGEIEYIFVDYKLQQPLYEYAISLGYTAEELEPILQYPHGPNVRTGLIRHARGHLNHAHIRFKCGPDDRNCR